MDPLEKNYGNGPTLQVARWVAGLSYRDLPERTKSVVRLTLLDTAGCGVYGYVTPWTQALYKWAQASASKGKARSWSGAPVTLRATDVALVN